MLIIYRIALFFYVSLIWVASFFNRKAHLFRSGRIEQQLRINELGLIKEARAWFHFSSLGEFEQGRPLIERWKQEFPGDKVIITFFSPSGYEIRKNFALADAVFYLPVDGKRSSLKFIRQLNPRVAIFTKYDFWYYYFNYLKSQHIPLYMISVIFRPEQIFFRWYGAIFRNMLGCVNWFFVQDETSIELLLSTNNRQASICGDTRFDRVIENAVQPQSLPEIKAFLADSLVFIAGSTWPADELLLIKLMADTAWSAWKFIIAPHETDLASIKSITENFAGQSVLHSELKNQHEKSRLLIIDNIGMLSSIYQFGDIAYIGGGFGSGIHNILEAGVFEIPVIFGPRYQKFKEAVDTVKIGGSFTIRDQEELNSTFLKLQDATFRKSAGAKTGSYIRQNRGATSMIISQLHRDNI